MTEPERPVEEPLTVGNAAKLYCLERIAELARGRDSLRILDLGCGDGRNFEALLRRHPSVRYVGVEPSRAASAAAAARLGGLGAEIVNDRAYDVRGYVADVVTSFSVLEHVHRRALYMACLAANLAPDGRAFVNYDAGHFIPVGTPSEQLLERWKARAARALAAIGRDSSYRAFVAESELQALVAGAGLEVVESAMFNTDLKRVYALVPEPGRAEFMRRWLELEVHLNTLGIEYRDDLASVFRTRNVVLRHAEAGRAAPSA